MEKVTCIIGLGSNIQAEQNLQKAHGLLVRAYPSIIFSDIIKTIPVGMKRSHASFLNQIARFDTEQDVNEVKTSLKIMERFCGHLPNDKENETIHIDIDLIVYKDTILKPVDFARHADIINKLQRDLL